MEIKMSEEGIQACFIGHDQIPRLAGGVLFQL